MLEDLGFSKTETQSNAAQQALLDKRTHMLKMHQRFGLITTVPLLATLVTSVNAGGKSTSRTSRDVHLALGAVTDDLYGITAYYAIRAPRIKGTETRGPIRLHKSPGLDSRPGHDSDPNFGRDGVQLEKQRRKRPWHRRCPRPGRDRHCWSFRGCPIVGITKILDGLRNFSQRQPANGKETICGFCRRGQLDSRLGWRIHE